VGAGNGATARLLCTANTALWLALEPDISLADEIQRQRAAGRIAKTCHIRVGGIDALHSNERFDTALYIDVLEHILNDREELERAAQHLTENGRLIVLAPAHQWLFTAFDKAIGHYRRYDHKMIVALKPRGLRLQRVIYLDSAGLIASLGNRLFLHSSMPTLGQIKFWDSFLVPISRIVDPLTGDRLGKSILAVWRREVVL